MVPVVGAEVNGREGDGGAGGARLCRVPLMAGWQDWGLGFRSEASLRRPTAVLLRRFAGTGGLGAGLASSATSTAWTICINCGFKSGEKKGGGGGGRSGKEWIMSAQQHNNTGNSHIH